MTEVGRDSIDWGRAEDFWKQRDPAKANRWTHAEVLDFEMKWFTRYGAGSLSNILDLGSGSGDLSRFLASMTGASLRAVDYVDYSSHFTGPNEVFEVCNVLDFQSAESFDAIFVFGVVTHLSRGDEYRLYMKIRELCHPSGTIFLKHQVSNSRSFTVDHFSHKLQSNYIGWYPSIAEQIADLEQLFWVESMVPYPPTLNDWETSRHVLFVLSLGPPRGGWDEGLRVT